MQASCMTRRTNSEALTADTAVARPAWRWFIIGYAQGLVVRLAR